MAVSNSATLFIFAFFLFLLLLMTLDIAMIVSLLKTGDERRQLIVWKASTGTLLIVVLSLVIQIAESIVRSQAWRPTIYHAQHCRGYLFYRAPIL